MREHEKADFAIMMTAVAELYSKKMSSASLSIYWAALERFSLVDIRRAITQHVNNADVGQFMPKPADIVRYLEGDSQTHALQAWSKVESAIRHIGSYDSIAFDDPIIHRVIADMGGWIKVCSISIKEMPFCSQEFIKRYQGYLHRKPAKYPKYLVGGLEHGNQTNSYDGIVNTVPVLIGDERLAMAVLKEGSDSSAIPIQRHTRLTVDFLKAIPGTEQISGKNKIKEKTE